MSSANFYSGYNPEKPTSKVLAPPGGRSNNIFGTSEAPNRTQHGTTAQEAAQNKANQQTFLENQSDNQRNHRMNNTSSILFGDDSTSNVQQQAVNKNQTDRMKSHIFEDQSNSNAHNAKNRNIRGAQQYNPITGQSYEKEEEVKAVVVEPLQAQVPVQEVTTKAEETAKPIHTSSRVLQPPGGRTTNLW